MSFITLENNKRKNSTSKAGLIPALCSKWKTVAKSVLIALGVALFWFIVWSALANDINKEVILPPPMSVIKRLFELAGESSFWLSCGITVLRIFSGLITGCVAGIVLSVIMLLSKIAKSLLSPLLSAVKATPVASFIIAALFWIDRSHVPAFISFLIVLPMICETVYTGVRNADTSLLEVARIYKFSFLKKIRYIWIPSAIPYFLSSLRTSVGMAWKSGVAAEVLCTPQNSIGKELNLTKVYMETADMFAWTLTIILLSIIFEKLTIWLVGKGIKKYGTDKEESYAED